MIAFLSVSSSSSLSEKNMWGFVLVGAALPDVAEEALRGFFYDRRAEGAGVPVAVTTPKTWTFSLPVTRLWANASSRAIDGWKGYMPVGRNLALVLVGVTVLPTLQWRSYQISASWECDPCFCVYTTAEPVYPSNAQMV